MCRYSVKNSCLNFRAACCINALFLILNYMYLQKDLHIWLVFVILCYDLVIQKVSIEGKSMEILYPISSLKVPKVN